MSTAVYFIADVLEASHGGFTSVQLWLTLASEAALPAFVQGLPAAHVLAAPRRLGAVAQVKGQS